MCRIIRYATLVVGIGTPASMTHGQTLNDLDSDGVVDHIDLDQDNDGIINALEGVSRLVDLADSPAHYYAVLPHDTVTSGAVGLYDLVSTEDGHAATLSGEVLSTNTEVEWSMQGALPKLRNLASGVSTVQWNIDSEQQVANIDLTISDLDGRRSESVAVSASSVVGYSVSLNSNIVVVASNGQLTFTGTGPGGDSLDDLVTLHFRESSAMLITYANQLSDTINSGAGGITAAGDSDQSGLSEGEIGIAGYRHSLGFISSTYFTPVTRDRDTDADGVADHRDLDSDNDGLSDVFESGGVDADNDNLIDGTVDEQGVSIFTDRGLSDASVIEVYSPDGRVEGDDADRDGLLSSVDGQPDQFGGARSGIDSDNDGLDDLDEIRLHHTDPDTADTDDDGLNDNDEIARYNTNPLQSDTDRDRLNDGDEVNSYGTSPLSVDSDADGVTDFEEIATGTDPLISNLLIVVTPAPAFFEADSTQEQDTVPTIVDPIRVDPIQVDPIGDEPIRVQPIQTEPDSEALLSDDASTTDIVALRTGLSGTAGCSLLASTSIDPGLLLILILALAGLTGKRRYGNIHA